MEDTCDGNAVDADFVNKRVADEITSPMFGRGTKSERELFNELMESFSSSLYREDDVSIKNEDFDAQAAADSLNFDIDAAIINASIVDNKVTVSSGQSLVDICTSLELGIDPAQSINVANEEVVQTTSGRNGETAQVKMISEDDLTAEYLMNSTGMMKNNCEPLTSLQAVSNDVLQNSDHLDVNTKIHLNSDGMVETRAGPGGDEECYKSRLHFVKYVNRDGKHVKIWECGVCAKEFGHQYTLMRHLPTHTDERKFQCNTCGKAFRQMSTLSQHRAIHSADRPYVCELCRKTFNRVSTLISHRKTHSGLKPHQCHLCHKAFHQKGNLRNHIFTHTNERPYKCDICQKGFNQMSNLMCHKLKAHQRNDKPKYICRLCNKEFPKRMALRNHEEYKHGIKIQNTETIDSCNNGMPVPITGPVVDPIASTIQTRVVQGENGEKMHIIHIPDLNIGTPMAPTNTASSARVRYTNGVLVDAINTGAMRQAQQVQQANGTSGSSASAPFALLHPIGGIPVLVRVLSAPHGKHMLVPATAEDLRAHALPSKGSGATTTIQIKIPVVATVVQKFELDGTMSMSVESPGPDNKQMIQDSINNTVENHKTAQFLNNVADKMSIAMPSNSGGMTFPADTFTSPGKTSYSQTMQLDEPLSLSNPNVSLNQDPQTSDQLYANNIQLNTFDSIQEGQQFEIIGGPTKTSSSGFPDDIIFGNQGLYNDVNSLTLYSQSPNEYTILP